MGNEERDANIAYQNVPHFTDGKHHNKVIDGMTVDIGTNFDWSDSFYEENRDVAIDDTSWVDSIHEQHDNSIKDQAPDVDNIVIPTQRNGDPYEVKALSNDKKLSMVQLIQ